MSELSKLSFCHVLEDIVRTGKLEGRSGKLHDVASLSSINNLLTIRNLLFALRPNRTLEIGLRSGGSALVFTQSHRDLGHAPSQQHTAVDPFQRSHWIDETGLIAVEKAGLAGYLDFREDYSCFALPQLAHENAAFQLIYVDGSHLIEDVLVDVYYSVRMLDKGGIILFDDSTDPHIAKVLSFIRKNMRHNLVEKDLMPFRSSEQSPWKYRVARFLGRAQLTGFEKIGDAEREWNSSFSNF